MNLYIDIGNSAVKFGVDSDNSIDIILVVKNEELSFEKVSKKLPKEVEKIYASSVVPTLYKDVELLIKELYSKQIRLISTLDDCGVNINIDNPQELGADLLCDLAAAKAFYELPILIIDAGTATKFLYIDENNSFYSCAIVPGYELQLNVLSKGTALLPNVEVKKVKPLLDCHNTIDVLTSSNYYAHVDMVNAMVKRYENEIGHPVNKVVTGGNITKIIEALNFEFVHDSVLCLKGIKIVGGRN